jgi:large subunit ribosomal protein L10
MPISRKKKAEILENLLDKFERADSAVFTGYKGMSVAELELARGSMREKGIDYHIAKKTLIKIAAKKKYDIEISDSVMEGPVGVAFGYEDSVSLCKELASIADKRKAFNLLGGIVEGKEIPKSMVEELSKMLSKDQLLAKFVGMIKSPATKFAGLLNAGTTSFARGLKAYAEAKEQGSLK